MPRKKRIEAQKAKDAVRATEATLKKHMVGWDITRTPDLTTIVGNRDGVEAFYVYRLPAGLFKAEATVFGTGQVGLGVSKQSRKAVADAIREAHQLAEIVRPGQKRRK